MYQEQNVAVKSGGSFGLSLGTMGFITFIVFLILKLTGTWPEISWFWVWFPLWIPWAIAVGLFLLILPIVIIIALKE